MNLKTEKLVDDIVLKSVLTVNKQSPSTSIVNTLSTESSSSLNNKPRIKPLFMRLAEMAKIQEDLEHIRKVRIDFYDFFELLYFIINLVVVN